MRTDDFFVRDVSWGEIKSQQRTKGRRRTEQPSEKSEDNLCTHLYCISPPGSPVINLLASLPNDVLLICIAAAAAEAEAVETTAASGHFL